MLGDSLVAHSFEKNIWPEFSMPNGCSKEGENGGKREAVCFKSVTSVKSVLFSCFYEPDSEKSRHFCQQ